MLGDSELDQLSALSNKYSGHRTIFSGATPQNYSKFMQTPDMISDTSGFADLINPDSYSSALDADRLMDSVVSGFAYDMPDTDKLANTVKDFVKIEGDKSGDGILMQLIKLILSIVELPMRFGYMSAALIEATAGLGVGIGGITQSVALATKDIYLLIITILHIIFKYFLCIVSFTVTTIGGCYFIHIFTLLFLMSYSFAIYITDKINDSFGINLSPMVDSAMERISWPSTIQTICYSCFGMPVKLRDVLADVGVIEDIGNMISYDFNNTMPRYMKPAIPFGKGALKSLDKAMN
jgi:hypothetical protein